MHENYQIKANKKINNRKIFLNVIKMHNKFSIISI